MPSSLSPTRDHAIQRTRLRLQRDSFPRLQMSFIVALTGGAGFLASFTLLHLGVHGMALRWPLALALGLAYLCFLGLLGLWLRWQTSGGPDLSSLGDLVPGPGGRSGSGSSPAPVRSGGGGDFGGGGASGSFELPAVAPGAGQAAELEMAASADLTGAGVSTGSGSSSFELPDVDLGDVADSKEGLGLLALLVAVLMVLAVALASLWVVWTAPALLSEVLVDGALSFTLYRHLRRSEPRHWLATVVRRTALPFVITAVFLAVAGGVLASVAPGARSLGEVWHQPAQGR